MNRLVVANWGKFQHYRDRNPPWIKLHTSLLDDYDYQKLNDRAKWQLLSIWLMAARQDNRIPDDRSWIASILHISPEDLELELLVDSGWLERRVAADDSAGLAPNPSAKNGRKSGAAGDDVSTKPVKPKTESNTRTRKKQPQSCPRF